MPRWEAAINKGLLKDIATPVLARLTTPEGRADMCRRIEDGTYNIRPPHTAKIPKEDPGEFRTVYVNEPEDRVLLIIANDLLFEKMPGYVHPRCKSYLKGVGCGKVVKEVSALAAGSSNNEFGFKADLSKYFDSVPLRYIDRAFDAVERQNGKSALTDVLRRYYHSEEYFNSETKQMERKFQSLKQGCSVAAWLADTILYHVDERLSRMGGYYVRYCDDILYIGKNYREAMKALEEELSAMEMTLNPKKVEVLRKTKWFKFLGFSIRGSDVSMSKSRLRKFQHEVEMRTTRKKSNWKTDDKETAYRNSIKSICSFLYKGRYCWGTSVLPFINVRKDVDEMNKFVMDCLRAVRTGKRHTGGLGYDAFGVNGVVVRGRGRNVRANREKTGRVDGYYTLSCMQHALWASPSTYQALCASM